MQIHPVYGDRPLVVVDLPPPGSAHPVIGQRRRLQATLAELTEAEWSHPSRCEGWSVQDVVTHLTTTNQFWNLSVQAALAGEPSRLLADFDPVASPARLVADAGDRPVADALAAFAGTNEALLAVAEGLDDDELDLVGEAPPGHVAVRQVLDHALWDAWIHERDVLLPLGRQPVEEADEVRVSLRYASALGPAFRVVTGQGADGPTAVAAERPHERFVVAVDDDQVRVHEGPAPDGAPVVAGPAVDLVEQLSFRDIGRPVPPAVTRLQAGLGDVFDRADRGE